MFAALLSLLFAQIGAAPVVGEHFKGQCLYPDAVLERAQDTTLVTCGEVDVAPDSLTFALRGWEPSIRFHGEWDGDRLTVTHIARRGRDEAEEARGLCQLYFANDKLSTIACTAVAGGRSYAANFVVSRI